MIYLQTLSQSHKQWITSISWKPFHLNYPCRRFVTSSKDGDARIWDIALRKSWLNIRLFTNRSWSPDSRMLLSGSKDSTLKVWDIGQRRSKQNLPGHEDEVYAVDWSPDGERVVSGGKDKCLKLWMS
ncbi:unnamed protein product [Arabis nemorensis]|uniref:Uncharacterized protein n=1 Tax=Arabis nemorensis TaxID=586526 RepID=A0A565CB87_9BRAS|nr:unnamed protein product [Arabis nemorensis]